MTWPVLGFQLSWDPLTTRGELVILAEDKDPVRISVGEADDLTALALLLKEPGVRWDGRSLWIRSDGPSRASLESFDLPETDASAKKIIETCEFEWPSNKSDCSGFVKDVATSLGISLTGQANDIVDQISGAKWKQLGTSGKDAKAAADAGEFVIGGLKGKDQTLPSPNGHVVVVVSGSLANDKYPTAYWGRLGGVGERFKTVNWAWSSGDRDRVTYAALKL